MNLNIISYLVYLAITYIVTVHIGLICYRNGIHYIRLELIDEQISWSVNRILLTGYYLVNMGYVSLMIYRWEKISSITEMVSSISYKTGCIIMLLGIMHFINMSAIYLARKNKPINS
jgi:uncharacterized membrane protein